MAVRPTYTELEQRIKELEAQVNKSGKIAESLNKQGYLQKIFDNIEQPIFLKSSEFKYLLSNNEYERVVYNSEPIPAGITDYDIFPEHVTALFRSQDK